MNAEACKTLETRSAYYYLKKNNNLQLYYRYLRGIITREDFLDYIPDDVLRTVIQAEMSSKNIKDLFARIDGIMIQDKVDHVDVLVGGPPCQAYSLVVVLRAAICANRCRKILAIISIACTHVFLPIINRRCLCSKT